MINDGIKQAWTPDETMEKECIKYGEEIAKA